MKQEMDAIRKAGFHFAWGVSNCFALFFIVGYVTVWLATPADDCDISKWDRCGLKTATDNKTGKQYLLSPYGGIIERPNNDQ